jgi:hypothetical protein
MTDASQTLARRWIVTVVSVVVCGLIPLVSVYYVFADVATGKGQIPDLRFAYYPAAKAILAGGDFYPHGDFVLRSGFVLDYVYPPLTAIAVIPLTVIPVHAAEFVFAGLLVVVFLATLAVLGVRDWRCYGLAFAWPCVVDAVQTGNVTIFLCFFAALAWRFRDHAFRSGASLGLSLATKILLWPLWLWLVASGRIRSALWSIGVATTVLLVTWGAIGFDGLRDYPGLLHRLSTFMDGRSYTVYALGLDLGLPSQLARFLWIVLGVGLLAATWVVARRGDDRRAFVLALTATLACTPIVWLHYLSFIVVAVAVMQPRLAPIWFMGFPMRAFDATGVYNGSPFQNAAMLLIAAVTVALALADGWPRLPALRPTAGRRALETSGTA